MSANNLSCMRYCPPFVPPDSAPSPPFLFSPEKLYRLHQRPPVHSSFWWKSHSRRSEGGRRVQSGCLFPTFFPLNIWLFKTLFLHLVNCSLSLSLWAWVVQICYIHLWFLTTHPYLCNKSFV